jgi:hypothetical protein
METYMRKLLTFLIALAALVGAVVSPVSAQLGGGLMFPGPGHGVSSGGGSYTGPGDIVSGASAWWGLRAYSAAYATALGNIADIVDTATGGSLCTMKAKATGDADLTSLSCVGGTVSVTTFCTVTHAAGCSVAKLYDQTGNGFFLTNSTLSKMPTLVLGSVSGLASNRPSMVFASASTQNLTSPLQLATPQPMTLTGVANRSGTSAGAIVASDTSNNAELRLDTAGTILIYSGGTPASQSETDGAWHSFAGVFTTTGAASFVNVDGSSGTGASVGTNGYSAGTSHARMGNNAFGSTMNGNVQEGGVWPSALSGTQISNLYNGTGGAKPYWGF